MAVDADGNEIVEETKTVSIKELVKSDPKAQEELNAMMADNRKKLTQQNSELVTQLEQLKKNSALTHEERDELQTRITTLEEQYMTKEELAKREAGKKERKFTEQVNTITGERDTWKTMYSNETIDRSIQDAAVGGEALHPGQVVQLLRTQTQLVEVISENGEKTGRYTPVVKFNDKTEDGKPVVLDLSPSDAIKRMKELPEQYGNLFKGTASGGLGESGGATGNVNQPSLKEITSNPVKYAEWRKKNPDLDISKLRRE